MPDNTPPFGWGPASFDERDLEDLLSGRLADTPQALRQVADALMALRGAPTPAERRGEAVIMAEFGALAEFGAYGQTAAGQAHTLVLPVPPRSGAQRRRGARHRSRRAGRPLSWRGGAFRGAAAAAVIVTFVAFSGSPIKSLTHAQTSAPPATHSAAGHPGSQNVAAKSAVPVPPAPSHAVAKHPAPPQATDGRTLCRTWFGDFGHPQPHSKWGMEQALFWQISKLAGGPRQVFAYCAPFVKDMFPHGSQWFHDGGKAPDPGDNGPRPASGGPASAGPGSGGPGSGGPGSGGNGPSPQAPGGGDGNGGANGA